MINRKNKLILDMKLKKGSIANVDNPLGKIYFYLNEDGRIVAKCGEKTAVANDVEIIENKKAIDVHDLGLEFTFIEVPADVEKAFLKAKNIKIMENCYLIHVGESVLTGKEYFRLNSEIPSSSWDCVNDLFEDFSSGSGRAGELNGWVTSQPEKVEHILGIKHAVSDRKEENDIRHDDVKKFDDAIAKLEKLST